MTLASLWRPDASADWAFCSSSSQLPETSGSALRCLGTCFRFLRDRDMVAIYWDMTVQGKEGIVTSVNFAGFCLIAAREWMPLIQLLA